MTYVIDTENAGRFDIGVSAAKYTKYIVQTYPESPKDEYQGELGLPDLRINPHVYWGKGDWNAALTGYYLSGQDEDYGGSNYAVGSHMEWSFQLGTMKNLSKTLTGMAGSHLISPFTAQWVERLTSDTNRISNLIEIKLNKKSGLLSALFFVRKKFLKIFTDQALDVTVLPDPYLF